MMRIFVTSVLTFIVLLLATPIGRAAVILGPTPYLAFDNSIAGAGTAISPFSSLSFEYFHLQNFENSVGFVSNNLLYPSGDSPGVRLTIGSGATIRRPVSSIVDSVDGDDGTIDGSGLFGSSFFTNNGNAGFQFSFSAATLGKLPTHAGLVWTDGALTGLVRFEAFGANNQSLGFLEVGGFQDNVVNGTTAEDRFFGVTHDAGISAIAIRSLNGGGLEIDHLQYGSIARTQAVPEPSSFACMAILGLLAAQRRCGRSVKHNNGQVTRSSES
jgi:hypothetical protein